MARTFQHDFDDLPIVGFPDWELLSRIDALIRPYAKPLPNEDEIVAFQAHDERGYYEVATLEKLRAEAEAQEQPPDRIWVRSSLRESGWFQISYSRSYNSGYVMSRDEAIVNHIATRLRALFDQAAARHSAEDETEGQEPLPTHDAPAEPSALHRFIYNPYTVAVASGLALAGIVAVIVFMF